MERSEIGIEFISVLGLPPLEFVQLAVELGCRRIGIALEPIVPGDGQLPLQAFFAALPASVSLGVEVPMLAKAEAGIGPRERLRPCLDSTWELVR